MRDQLCSLGNGLFSQCLPVPASLNYASYSVLFEETTSDSVFSPLMCELCVNTMCVNTRKDWHVFSCGWIFQGFNLKLDSSDCGGCFSSFL
jgi:hypothetical protein